MERRQLKAQAKSLMRTGSPRPVYVSLVYVIILVLFAILSYKLVGQPISDYFNSQFGDIYKTGDYSAFESMLDKIDPEQFLIGLQANMPSGTAQLLDDLLTVLGWVIGAGFVIFTLHTVDGTEASMWNLFDGFAMFFRVIWLHIVEAVFIFLWALLFVFPAFIAAYSYRMALYLLLEHPEMSVMECIRESKRIMRGHKWELFVLDLSFIGWALLVGVVNTFGSMLGIELLTIVGLGNIVYIWMLPFMNISYSLYYRQLTAPKIFDDYIPEL